MVHELMNRSPQLNTNPELPDLYCPSMWKSAHLDTDGYITPCCMFIDGKFKKYKITDVTRIEDVLVNQFQEYRDQLTAGEWPEGCNQCKFAEQEGRSSKRIQDLYMLDQVTNGKLDTFPTPPSNVALEYLQLKTGRLCNLKCTICTPTCSTSIASEQLAKGQLDRATYDRLQKQIEWSYDINEYKKLDAAAYYRIDIAGGEPLMNKTHFEWLTHLAETTDTSRTQLLYNTNGTIVPNDEEIAVWAKFKGVWVAVSMDSYGKKFEFLRVGANWDNVLSNLKFIEETVIQQRLPKGASNTSIVMTIHKGNVLDIFGTYKAINDHVTIENPNFLNFNYLYYPEHMAIHNMPKERMKVAIDYIDNGIHQLPEGSLIYNETVKLRNTIQSFYESDKKVEDSLVMPEDHRTHNDIITDDIN
jgi:radical SAM protein with 4Fe4S-binding SPASM domain